MLIPKNGIRRRIIFRNRPYEPAKGRFSVRRFSEREEAANDFPGAGLRHAAAIPAAGKRAGTGCKTKIADKSSIDCQRFALYPEPGSNRHDIAVIGV